MIRSLLRRVLASFFFNQRPFGSPVGIQRLSTPQIVLEGFGPCAKTSIVLMRAHGAAAWTLPELTTWCILKVINRIYLFLSDHISSHHCDYSFIGANSTNVS